MRNEMMVTRARVLMADVQIKTLLLPHLRGRTHSMQSSSCMQVVQRCLDRPESISFNSLVFSLYLY